MSPVVLAMPGNEALARSLAGLLGAESGAAIVRRFPDGESYVRIDSDVACRAVIVVCTLDRPDDKVLALLLLAAAARERGAEWIGLVAPYLAYMRQDTRFHVGETVSARHFAGLISNRFDALVTVDPHLHRFSSLAKLYAIRTRIAPAADGITRWIRDQIEHPVLIGPDSESAQWVEDIARRATAPYTVLRKVRRGDRDVEVSLPSAAQLEGRTPVLVDDIVSTAQTMIKTVQRLRSADLPSPVCIAVHAIFAGTAYAELLAAGAARIVSCNSVAHQSNAIALDAVIAQSTGELLTDAGRNATAPEWYGELFR